MKKKKKLNEFCKDCPHLDKHTNIEGVSPLCGVALGLAHWQDAKNWPYIEDDNCEYKSLSDYESQKLYLGR